MTATSYTIEVKGKKPFVIIQLKQYEAMLEHMEELEDKASIRERAEEATIPLAEVEKKFKKKFGVK